MDLLTILNASGAGLIGYVGGIVLYFVIWSPRRDMPKTEQAKSSRDAQTLGSFMGLGIFLLCL